MKKISVSFEGVDTTGYLFTLTKCLSAALRSGGYEEYAEDVIAASGFAFRTWAAADLCPSAMSVWEFKKQKPWAENCGLVCDYTERMWGEDAVEKERREKAIEMIKRSVDSGVGAVVWDLGDCEWGIVTGYDDDSKALYTLKTDRSEDSIPYEKLGQLEIPILSVLTVVGKEAKDSEQMVADTKALIAAHLRGEEWCGENTQGLAAYDTVIAFIKDKLTADNAWNLEYYLGTYAALRYYGRRFFEKYGERSLAALYEKIHSCWQEAFELKRNSDVTEIKVKEKLVGLLKDARDKEAQVLEILSRN